jgi:hypothetical protein
VNTNPSIVGRDVAESTVARDQTDLIFRSDKMSLINEALARARCHELHADARQFHRARRLRAARRLERRAARAASRARRLADAAITATVRL